MKRALTAVLAGATVATLAYASASVLEVSSKPLQAGSASVTCDTDGVRTTWGLETDTNSVNGVKIHGLAEACYGQDASIFVAVDGKRVGDVKLTTYPGDGAPLGVSIDSRTPESINYVKVWIG